MRKMTRSLVFAAGLAVFLACGVAAGAQGITGAPTTGAPATGVPATGVPAAAASSGGSPAAVTPAAGASAAAASSTSAGGASAAASSAAAPSDTAAAPSASASSASPAPQRRPKLTLGAEGGYVQGGEADYWNGPTGRAYINLDYEAKYFYLVAALSMYDNKKYGPTVANISGGHLGNAYFLMDEGGIGTHVGPFDFSAGRFKQYDVIASPYSLFVNSDGNSALGMKLDYEDDVFFYETRWIELNSSSAVSTPSFPTGFPDRGANLKVYGFKIAPGMRFGFQDADTYTGRSFDPDYFFNPIPGYFIQYVKTVDGTPWYTGGYENSIVGMFWDWKRDDGLSFNAQVLIDDFSVFGLGGTPNNPWKLAWTFGGRMKTKYGTFGLYQAGATRYTFQATKGNAYPYSYTYYPDTRFPWGSDYYAISIEDNSLGYKYGEDNLALLVDWTKPVSGCDLYASLEFLLAGTNSPTDPWNGQSYYPGGTELLDDATIEKRVLATVSASWPAGRWRVYGSVSGGFAVDPLALVAAPNAGTTGDYLYAAQTGQVQALMQLTIGAAYTWDL